MREKRKKRIKGLNGTSYTLDITALKKFSDDIIDMEHYLDVATWNRKITSDKLEIPRDASYTKGLNFKINPEIPPIISIGLRRSRDDNIDILIDSANHKDVDQAYNSGAILTDKTNIFKSKHIKKKITNLTNRIQTPY